MVVILQYHKIGHRALPSSKTLGFTDIADIENGKKHCSSGSNAVAF
jgi:hypothetical protein